LARRLVERLGAPVDTGVPGLTHTFPEPKDLLALGGDAQDILGQLGIISARGRCLVSLAREMAEGRVRLEPPAQPEEEMQKLLGIKGIGPWTAQYILMRTLGYPDAFLETDAGVKQALPGRTAREMLALAEAWRPYRSYAVMNLWNSLQPGGERGI
ncbi:MAG TPA: adenosine deaminase, partial [Clostridia bacterium]|nr:adenosine deaminase [Clostridia bacterium]